MPGQLFKMRSWNVRRIGVRGSLAARRLANPVTLCDGHGVFFVAASGQIQMAADSHTVAERSGHYIHRDDPDLITSIRRDLARRAR